MSESKIVEYSPNVFASLETGNVYQFEEGQHSRTKPDTIRKDKYEIIKWGTDNILPYLNRRILAENDIKQNLIDTDVNIAAGQYLYLYKESIENGKRITTPVADPELEDWLEEFRIHELFTETLQDIKEMGNSWVEFVLSRDKTKITSMISQDALDCRLNKVNKSSGRRDSDTLLLADWKNDSAMNNPIEAVPLLDIRNPQLGKDVKCAYHVKKIVSGMPYYSLVEWYGTKDWTEIANLVPKFHKQGLKNGYTGRWIIKIPMSYFDGKTGEALEKAKTSVRDELDKFAGVNNSHKALITFINDKLVMGSNTQMAEWKIEPIETDLKDDSYLKLHETASKVHARGHNIDPALAGIQTEGRLSAGSEIRNLVNFHIAYKTPRPRRIAMAPIILAKNFNFPDKKDIKIGIGDIELTTLDESTNGTQIIQSNA